MLEVCNEGVPCNLGTVLDVYPLTDDVGVGFPNDLTHSFDEFSTNGSTWFIGRGAVGADGLECVDDEVDAIVGGGGPVFGAVSGEVAVCGELVVAVPGSFWYGGGASGRDLKG